MEKRILIYEPYSFFAMVILVSFLFAALALVSLHIFNRAFYPEINLLDGWKKVAYFIILFSFFLILIILLRKKLFSKIHVHVIRNLKQSEIDDSNVFWIDLSLECNNKDKNVYLFFNKFGYKLIDFKENSCNDISNFIFILPKLFFKHLIILSYCKHSYAIPLNDYENNIVINLIKEKNE